MNNKSKTYPGILLIALMLPLSSAFSTEITEESETDKKISRLTYGLSDSYNSFSEESGWLDPVWGRPFSDHLYLGMWTQHFSSGDDQENTNNLLGVTYNGYYAGTFINTHSDQVVTAGWHRALYRDKWGIFDVEAGYRLGMMYGYTRYLQLGNTKFFPLLQTVLDIDYNGFGIELSWAGVIVSGGFYYRF